ncbi:MAG: 4Fe-4S binding protein [Planctomycetota bacterium]
MIFSYGLFTIAAQTLLFRQFITTFEGNDISVGIFFGSWFLWVGLGAILVRKVRAPSKKLLDKMELLFLGYLPAFILELILIVQARELAGVESYALLPIRSILILSIAVNAPVSIITGMLFPLACRWFRQQEPLAVSRVYIFEAAGSFCGGLGVTVLLASGMSLAMIFLLLCLVLSLSVLWVQLAGIRQTTEQKTQKKLKTTAWCVSLIPAFILLCLILGADKALTGYIRTVKWTKLLPADALTGSFQTAQAEYLYGNYQNQWIAVRQGSVCEALPDETTAGRIVALTLCQNPAARRILIIGSGIGLCRQFLQLPQIEHLTWAHCDNEYVEKVNRFIPPELKISDERFYPFDGDVRSLLTGREHYYDLTIVNLPEATSSVLNRYYTVEFYNQLKRSLRAKGVLAVSVAGGENIMGTELINLGASTKLTLQQVFSALALTPGEQIWFLASDSQDLTGEPGTLRDRFAAIQGVRDIFPPEGLLSVYLPDRAAKALENYSRADLPDPMLINRDSKPLTHLYSLLLAAKQSEAPVTKFIKHLLVAGPLTFFVPILVLVALRIIYILKTKDRDGRSSFDSTFLVFSAGVISIGTVIVLMYLYQTWFGSLYLHIGVISSLFMAGLTAGAVIIANLLLRRKNIPSQVLPFVVILVHTTILTAIGFWPEQHWTHLSFALAFVLCGLCTGCYFPLAAGQLADYNFETGQAGSKLETADHLGASVGGLLTGLILVPVLGAKITLSVFILLILANIPPAALRIYKPQKTCIVSTLNFRLRRLAYVLFGIGLSVILCSNLLAHAGTVLQPALPEYAAQALAGDLGIEPRNAVIDSGARKIKYFEVYETQEQPTGYIFSSQQMAPDVRGFGGKMNLAIYTDAGGKLIDFHIIRSNETPSYLELLDQWRGLLTDHQLFSPEPFANIDAVTGATVSSKAVLLALQQSGHKFTAQVLSRPLQTGAEQKTPRADYLPDTHGIYLVTASILSLIVIWYGGFWSRLVVLCLNLVIGGFVLNTQYSSEQIATVLSLQGPALGLSGAFLLTVGIPFLVLIFGNIYCGYICPFGAAQELLGFVIPERLKEPIPAEKMRKARFVKYVMLFILIIAFFVSRNRTTLAADPLIEIFNLQLSIPGFQTAIINWKSPVLLIVILALIGSLFYTRFWCRYLCPVGAFLSLLNNLVILRRLAPAKNFAGCEFGLTAKDKLDCICCDRCRYQLKTASCIEAVPRARPVPAKALSRYFMAGVLTAAVIVSTVSVKRFVEVVPAAFDRTAASAASGGEPRDIDLQRMRTMIRQKKLADEEAQFYKKLE